MTASLAAAIALLASGAAAASPPGAGDGAADASRSGIVEGSDLASAVAPRSLVRPVRPSGTRSDPEASPRIVGGEDAAIASWPWQTSIGIHLELVDGDAFERHIGGGALVAPRIVVSAAHCFFHEDGFVDPATFQAVTGRTQLSGGDGETHDVDEYHLFVDGDGDLLYDPDTGEWDVTVVELASPGSSAETVRIAGPGEEPSWTPGSAAWVTGWGATSEGGEGSDVLQQALIEIIADSACASPEVYGSNFVSSVMFCAGNLAGGTDACQGDSGGPLVVPIDDDGGFRLVGNTSWGVGCGQPNQPGVYGRLASDPIRSRLQAAIEEIAGVDVVGPAAERSPQLRVTSNPRRARVRQGRTRAFKLGVRNVGDAAAEMVSVCARGAKRKARIRGKRCRGLGSIAPGEAKGARFKARIGRRVRGGFWLRFKLRAGNHPTFTERARARISR